MADNRPSTAAADTGGGSAPVGLSGFSTRDGSPDETLRVIEKARARCPVAHSDEFGGFHVLLRYDDIKGAATDWRTFSSEPSVLRPLTGRKGLAIDYDPPAHTGWRDLIRLAVDASTARNLESKVRADVVALIDTFAPLGECDLVSDFAEQVPLLAICHVLDFDPDKRGEVRRLSRQCLAALKNPETLPAAFLEFEEFVVPPVLEKRGSKGDDFPTKLANATLDGRPLSVAEIARVMMGLLIAGHETTVSALTSLCFEVLRDLEVRDRLIEEPDLIPKALEEALRLHPPVFGFYRRATRPVEVSGVEIPAGRDAYLCWAAANRDPNSFDDASSFRLDRARRRHLTFGFGVHACPGAPIGRMEMQVALTELLERLPTISLVDADQVDFEFGGTETLAIQSLRARFDPLPSP